MAKLTWTPQEDSNLLNYFDQKRELTTLSVEQIAKTYAHLHPQRSQKAYVLHYHKLKRQAADPTHKPPAYEALETLIHTFSAQTARIAELEKRIAILEPIEQEYAKLCQIIEAARKVAFQPDEPAPKFRMDANGNLERL